MNLSIDRRSIASAAKALALAGAAAAALASGGMAMDGPGRTKGIQPARDGNIAIAEELDSARRAGTVAAYDLFIARHPGHPLAEIAQRERAKLRGRTGAR